MKILFLQLVSMTVLNDENPSNIKKEFIKNPAHTKYELPDDSLDFILVENCLLVKDVMYTYCEKISKIIEFFLYEDFQCYMTYYFSRYIDACILSKQNQLNGNDTNTSKKLEIVGISDLKSFTNESCLLSETDMITAFYSVKSKYLIEYIKSGKLIEIYKDISEELLKNARSRNIDYFIKCCKTTKSDFYLYIPISLFDDKSNILFLKLFPKCYFEERGIQQIVLNYMNTVIVKKFNNCVANFILSYMTYTIFNRIK